MKSCHKRQRGKEVPQRPTADERRGAEEPKYQMQEGGKWSDSRLLRTCCAASCVFRAAADHRLALTASKTAP